MWEDEFAVYPKRQDLLETPKKDRTEAMYIAAIQEHWQFLRKIHEEDRTEAMYVAAIQKYWLVLREIPKHKHSESMYIAALQRNWEVLREIPEENCTKTVYLAAIQQNWEALLMVPILKRTEEIYLAAIEKDWRAIEHIPVDICNDAVQNKYFETLKQFGIDLKEEDKRFFLSLSKDDRWFVTNLLSESSLIGKITLKGGMFTCTQVAARKPAVHPVILASNVEQFTEFLEILNKAPHPIRERFVLTGGHWLAGDINIDANGHATILLLDSLGIDKLPSNNPHVEEIKRIFKSPTVYAPKLGRQTQLAGCSVFALDDVRHLYTIENYLPPAFKKTGGLFDYLEAQKLPKDRPVIPCELPLPFMRTMQSRQLISENKEGIIANRSIEEQKSPVDKKGNLLTVEFARINFFQGNWNLHLNDKLNKMVKANWEYIKTHDVQTIKNSMKSFAFEHFKQKMGSALNLLITHSV